MSAPETYRVAVYGTLRQGCSNHDLLATACYLGCTRIAGLAMYDLGFCPAARFAPASTIEAEIYDVDGKTLADLDRLEGCDINNQVASFYYCHLLDSDYGPVWVYIYQAEMGEGARLAEGVWSEQDS